MIDLSIVDDAVLSVYGDTYTYYPKTGASYDITAARDSGERFQTSQPGAYASLFVIASDMEAEPVKGDQVLVPSGREITAGTYRVADISKDDAGGRVLLLQWVRQ